MSDASVPSPSSAPGPRRALWVTSAVLVVVVAVLVGVLLVRGGDDNDDEAADTTTASTTISSTTTSTSTTTPDAAVTTGPNEPPADLSFAATTPVSVPPSGAPTAQLTAVRVGTHQGYIRIAFEFDGAVPGYDVGYLDGPLLEDGSGAEVPIEGERILSVRMTPASAVRMEGEGFTRTYTGPDRLTSSGGAVTEVVEAGDFEAQMTWGIGTTAGQRFAVSTLESPSRLIVDVVNE
jgi:hypothetical protein